MDKKLMCTHCDAETYEFRDLVAGMPHANCPQGAGTWFEPANTGLQADGAIPPLAKEEQDYMDVLDMSVHSSPTAKA